MRRLLEGAPLDASALAVERMRKLVALPVLSAHALSSVAYGPEAMLAVLVLAGAAGLPYSLPVGGAIMFMMLAVGVSYRQTIRAYPQGGGSNIMASEEFGCVAVAEVEAGTGDCRAASIVSAVLAAKDGVPDDLDHRFGVADGFLDPAPHQRVNRHRCGALQGQADREDPLCKVVVKLAGDAIPVRHGRGFAAQRPGQFTSGSHPDRPLLLRLEGNAKPAQDPARGHGWLDNRDTTSLPHPTAPVLLGEGTTSGRARLTGCLRHHPAG
jgi:hypothetical protein